MLILLASRAVFKCLLMAVLSAQVLERQIVFHSAAAQAALLILIASENSLEGLMSLVCERGFPHALCQNTGELQ